MPRSSKRVKTTAAPTPVNRASQGRLFIPFQSGPSLERVPDDILLEILAYFPTLTETHALFAHRMITPVIPSALLTRTPTLRALSQVTRLLRSRCLAMAWQNIELCATNRPHYPPAYYMVIGEATMAAVRVLKACPHLLPFVQTVSVVLTRFQCAKIVPAFAKCLATLPNLTTIQVIHAHRQLTTTIKNGFEGKKLVSVRRISLPSSAHEIIKSCPNVEEVTCTEHSGSTIVGSIIKGDCRRIRVLKDIDAPLTRLVKLHLNLTHIRMAKQDMTLLSEFPLLDTIEIDVRPSALPPTASCVKQASEILKNNESKAEKTVVVLRWENLWGFGKYDEFNADDVRMTREVIKL